MKKTQREANPFVFSDTNKRYQTYDYYLKHKFGEKVAKIPLDAGLTCPNIDGKCGYGGCVYCSARGGGDFAPEAVLSFKEQYEREKEKLLGKWNCEHCIPYLQAHTNTYAPTERLIALYEEALALPGAVGLNIATRADCLDDDSLLTYLQSLTARGVITLELGLQTALDRTAALIRRGHDLATFKHGYAAVRRLCPDVKIGVHVILGLPGENEEEMLGTIRQVADLRPDFVKLHLLHVLQGTTLAEWYEAGQYTPLERETYVHLIVRSLALLPPETVVERLTGDGKKEDLLAPLWSRDKLSILNEIDRQMVLEDTWQGKYYDKPVF